MHTVDSHTLIHIYLNVEKGDNQSRACNNWDKNWKTTLKKWQVNLIDKRKRFKKVPPLRLNYSNFKNTTVIWNLLFQFHLSCSKQQHEMEKVLSGEFWFFVQLGAFLVLVQWHRCFYHLCQQDIRPLENLKITYNSVSSWSPL